MCCRLGQACNHIAALLFFIEYHANDEDLPTEISKTSKPMAWNQPPKKFVAAECSSNMRFVKPSHGDNPDLPIQRISRSTFDPRPIEHQGEVDRDRVNNLISRVRKSMPSTGLQHFWCEGPNKQANPNDITLWSHVLFSHGSLNPTVCKQIIDPTTIMCQQFLECMKLTDDQVSAIDAATCEQSDSELWQALRNGRLTSSRFGEILKRRPTTDSCRLVKDIMGYNGPLKKIPPQIRWGRENEAKARHCYIENRRQCGEDMVVEASGLHLLPNKSFIGASPDGRILCRNIDTCNHGCLEIKCPYSINHNVTVTMTPEEIADEYPDFFMKRGDDGLLHLPCDHAYYAQVQGEMAVLNVEWCDFTVFSNGTVVVDRIIADYDYWTELQEKL